MKVAVTGASGLLGANLAALLAHDGHHVVCTRRATSRTAHLDDVDLDWREADLDDLPALTRAFDGCRAVFHCAALVSLRRKPTAAMWRTNVTGTLNVMHAVRAAGVERLVYTSSIEALGLSDGTRPANEEAPHNVERLGLSNGYARTKRQAKLAVHDAAARDIDAVIISPTVMLGPRDARPSSGELIVRVCKGMAVGWPGGSNNFVDVRDVARGMVQALEHGRRGRDYILGHENRSFRDVMTRIAELAGVRPPRFALPGPLTLASGVAGELIQALTGRELSLNLPIARYLESDRYQFDITRARTELGYDPGPVDDAIVDALDWFRMRGMV